MTSRIYQSPGYKCPIHGGFSNLNRCAWPDRPHGETESSVEVCVPGLEKTERFQRISWSGPNDGSFHDWQTDVMPSWFRLHGPYSYFRNKLVENEYLDSMFHYTSADGALAILQSGRLRFTDYAYLNDTREVTYGLDVIRSVLDKDVCVAGSQALVKLNAHIEDGNPFSPYNIYTASFSSQPDSLSQFRLYGPIALGFETNPTGFGYLKSGIHVGHIVYGSDKQAELIELFFDLVKQSEEKDAALIARDEKKQLPTDYLIGQLLPISALFKHPAFSDEREVRLLYSEPLEIMDKFGQDVARRQFRTSGGLVVPFTDTFDMTKAFPSDTGTQHTKTLPLKSVVIGPVAQAEVLARGIRDLLNFQGYHDVEVSLSEAPFRS